ncbi:penicillin acylase family protein [Methylicorpusculum sp.]|uniref:penicillin acylase family protein n=1 Tax=Methylicorpusculum sp. TaxID=2713644 RepID=UPI00272F7E94|nr:penicillin acylase family protein [Methylicorpusculum sp.]MDP2178895.1 penicillin acylase family protein [Methylicorpusculum sp.]MDP3530280.1 penicillin acylase family protein [Methylicorpusculum sp.]MDZ4151269.1 penicillin acylase family protein [Methylicorpusculum sp.]
MPAILIGSGCIGIYWILQASLSVSGGHYRLSNLSSQVTVAFDEKGIPSISAGSREDAFRALGFVTARDRLFQMDLLRRHMAGRLAEVMGPALKESDRRHRLMGFEQVASAIVQRLPQDQKQVLEAYAEGVNQAVDSLTVLPPEFWLLGYSPSAWRPEDSLLVVLGMEEDLGWTGDAERRSSIMEAALPESVMRFFIPPIDHYTDRLLNGKASAMPLPSIPENELSALLNNNGGSEHYVGLVTDVPPPKGSNGWVVGPSKTWDGRAILANDMHLSLRVPNIWYRAEVRYGDVRLTGLTLPGVPLIVVGSNGKVAWGFTNIEGDFVDLVSLELDLVDPGSYRTPKGKVRFGEREETVRVKGEVDFTFKVQTTEWGPVLPESLLSKPAAVHWAALDPDATDLHLLNLDAVNDVQEAQTVFNRAGGPPLNALTADKQGNIGWTYTGKIPKRFGLDGSVSRSWADGSRGWAGYILPEELPRLVNPPSGFIVNANQRMLGDGYPYVIGHYFDQGHRAYRIAERLSDAKNLTERDMFALQLDTKVEFYRFYQRLALSLLHEHNDKVQVQLKQNLTNWDGFAERDSVGFAVLVEFRKLLLDAVIAPFMTKCREYDPEFRFDSAMIDEPLQQLLEAKLPALLPDKIHYRDWDSFLLNLLIQAEGNVSAHNSADFPKSLAWGAVNQVTIAHPFSDSLPLLRNWLDMPKVAVPGCVQCVRMGEPGYGASERLVVSPGREGNGILHMPGGQSGHPLSPHYGDQQQAWVEGTALPLESGTSVHRLELVPHGG